MNWRNRTIKILSQDEIEKRYPKENDTKMAKLTREFVERGYQIVYIKMDALKKETASMRRYEIDVAVEIVLENDNFEIGCYTDLSELQNDVIYVAAKELGEPKNYYH